MPSMTGHGDAASVDLTEALSRLRADREAIAWPERRRIVARIAGPLAEGLAGDPFRSLLMLLVEDPKWEVRKDVADALAAIPDNDLAMLADRLLADSHAYVRRAAQQSIERRRKAAREAQKRKRGVNLVLALYQELEDEHGKAAANKARRLAEQLYDVLIGATVHEMRSVLTALKEDNAQIIERDHAGSLESQFLRRKSHKIADRLAFMERLLQDNRSAVQREDVALYKAILRFYGTWDPAMRAAGIDPKKVRCHRCWDRQAVIRRIQQRAAEGLPLYMGIVEKTECTLPSAALRCFSSWGEALEAAGIDPTLWCKRVPTWTRERVIDTIRTIHARGEPVNHAALRRNSVTRAAIVFFGSWDEALRAAGLDPSDIRRRAPWKPAEVLQEIRRKARAGEPLNARDVAPHSLRSRGTLFFGSWDAALVAAGLDPAGVRRNRGRDQLAELAPQCSVGSLPESQPRRVT